MSEILDTSVVVRYLIGTPVEAFEKARGIIDTGTLLVITDVVLVETAYVLTSFYKVPRQIVVDHLIEFIRKTNIQVHGMDEGTVILALLLCRPSGRVSFSDALIWAVARSMEAEAVYSFDRRFPSEGIILKEDLGE